MRIARLLPHLIVFSLLPGGPVFAFENAQHQNITTYAIGQISPTDYPDIVRFGPNIISWSWGLGSSSNLNRTSYSFPTEFLVGKPAEELAHLGLQQGLIGLTAGIDGGNFSAIANFASQNPGNILLAYQSNLFANESPGSEGAYVWAGAAAHLIEDQASPPHAANILHGLGDRFEGPIIFHGSKISNINNFDPNVAAGNAVDQYYQVMLTLTQNGLPGFTTPEDGVLYQIWLPNNSSALRGFQKNPVIYDGTPPTPSLTPMDSEFNGEYGGIVSALNLSTAVTTIGFFQSSSAADIYNQNPAIFNPLHPVVDDGTVFATQSTLAAEHVYNFLVSLSLKLPPVISALTIGLSGTRPPVIDPTSGVPINLTIAENRSSSVNVTMTVTDTAQAAATTNTTTLLDPAITDPSNTAANPTFIGDTTWSGTPIPLFPTINDTHYLPFQASINTTWTGLVSGTALSPGQHQLCVTATDGDNNASQPVCAPFIIDAIPSFASVTDGNGQPLASPAQTSSNAINFTVTDNGSSGISRVILNGPGGTAQTLSAAGAPSAFSGGFTGLVSGAAYTMTAYDTLNTPAVFSLNSIKTPQRLGAEASPVLLNTLTFNADALGIQPETGIQAKDGSIYLGGLSYSGGGFVMRIFTDGNYLLLNGYPQTVTSLAVDAGGSIYASDIDGNVFRNGTQIPFPLSTTPNLYGQTEQVIGENGGIAVDSKKGITYVATQVFVPCNDALCTNQNDTTKFAAFDSNLKLIGTAYRPPTPNPFWPVALEGIAVDDLGDVYAAESDAPANTTDNSGVNGVYGTDRLLIDHFSSGLSGGIFSAAPAGPQPFRGFSTQWATIGAAPGGGALASYTSNSGALVNWSSKNGFDAVGPSNFTDSGPYGVVAGSNVYLTTYDPIAQVPTLDKMSLTDDFLWQTPPTVPGTYPPIVLSASPGFFENVAIVPDPVTFVNNLLIQFYGPPSTNQAASSDGQASVVSPVPATSIAPVSPSSISGALAVATNQQGLTQAGPVYQISPSPQSVNPPALLSVTFNPSDVNLATVAIYRFNGTIWDPAPITGQTLETLPSGLDVISGYLGSFSLYGVFYSSATDSLPPRTALNVGSPSYSTGTMVYSTEETTFTLTATDDYSVTGDSRGIGVALTSLAIDTSAFSVYSGSFSLSGEGPHVISYFSVDIASETESTNTATINLDLTPPITTLQVLGSSTTDIFGNLLVPSGTALALSAIDPISSGVASGLNLSFLVIDADPFSPECEAVPIDLSQPSGTCANEVYDSSFTISGGTHTIYFYSEDNVGNPEALNAVSIIVQQPMSAAQIYSLNPTTGPIGIPFTITGSGGFGPYAGAATKVLMGGATAPLSVWNDTTISGTIPGLSTGTYPVVIQSSTSALSAGFFSVLMSSAGSISISSAPIGAPFTITGAQFGPYAGALTRVLIGGATAPLSVWNDSTISGTLPGLSTGTYPLSIQRSAADGAFMSIAPFSVQVIAPSPSGLSPSSGPIGVPFTVSGSGFGPYAGTLTQLLFDGAPAPLSVWNDSTITGAVPSLSSGTHAVWVQRRSSDGGLATSDTGYFTVTVPSIGAISPSSGPIGATFSLTGASFGPYAGALTQVLFNGATVPLSVWNDANISGVVPGGLAPGAYPVVAERLTSNGGLVLSNTAYFQVVGVHLFAVSPATGPIGIPFMIAGSGFGAYDGANTLVLLGGTSAQLSVWNDASISGTVPALSTGAYPVYVERIQGASTAMSCVATFTVTALAIPPPDPATGPIGATFTLTGGGYGPYAGGKTQVLIGGATAALNVWNDGEISGTVPTLSTGTQPLWLERFSGSSLQTSNTVYFQVVRPAIAQVSPSSGPIGVSFTLTGSGFGAYAGSNTQVLFNGTTTALSVWNDTQITGTVPGALAAGDYDVKVERIAADGGSVLSAPAIFTVIVPSVSGMNVSSGPIGVPFTIAGSGFGTYSGSATQVFFSGVPAPLSVWNDSTISGSVPALSTGVYSLSLARQQGGYVQSAFVSTFTVILPRATSLTPSAAPIGATFTIGGTGFGPYAGANTLVLIGGATAPLSIWNDSQVSGRVPGALAASAGVTTITLERIVGSSVVAISAPFEVELPVISTLTPTFGPGGTGVSIAGTGFGTYAGAATSLLLNGTTVPLAVWNDANIVWTVPDGFPDGTYPLVVQLSPADGGVVQSASATFTVGSGAGVQSLALAAPLAAHPDWYFAGSMNLPATQDNKIQTPSQAAVTVSSGALTKDTVVTVANARALHEADRLAALTSAGLGAAGEAISFGPEGTQFAKPVTIQLPYDPNLVPPGLAGSLTIGFFDPTAKTWTPLDTIVDTTRHLLSAKTSHFSLYQPLGVGIGLATAAQDVFGLRAFYVFPNPARGTNAATFRIQPGLADSVEVRIYDVTGRKVHSSSDFRASLLDDGNGLGAQDTYDHAWDLSGVGSGIYTYVITAKKFGQKDIHAAGKAGVIK